MAFDLSPAPVEHGQTPLHCRTCPVQDCLSHHAETADDWRQLCDLRPPLKSGDDQLVEVGKPLPALFAVRAGCIKSFTIDNQGNEHIRAFHLPGDLVGLDALGASTAPSSAAPVAPSQVCAANVDKLGPELDRNPAFNRYLLSRTRTALGRAMAMSGEHTAEQRVASFVVDMHKRIGSGAVIRLPMTRREIGSYLRLATETVCRVLTRFEKKGLLSCKDKRVTLLNLPQLKLLAESVGL